MTGRLTATEQKRRNYALLCAIWCGAGGGVLDLMLLEWGTFERYLLDFAVPTNAAPVDIWVIVAVAVWTIGTGLVAVFIGGIAGWFIGRHLAATSVALFVLAALPLVVLGLGFVYSIYGGRLTTLEYFEFGTIAATWVGIPFLLRAKAVI